MTTLSSFRHFRSFVELSATLFQFSFDFLQNSSNSSNSVLFFTKLLGNSTNSLWTLGFFFQLFLTIVNSLQDPWTLYELFSTLFWLFGESEILTYFQLFTHFPNLEIKAFANPYSPNDIRCFVSYAYISAPSRKRSDMASTWSLPSLCEKPHVCLSSRNWVFFINSALFMRFPYIFLCLIPFHHKPLLAAIGLGCEIKRARPLRRNRRKHLHAKSANPQKVWIWEFCKERVWVKAFFKVRVWRLCKLRVWVEPFSKLRIKGGQKKGVRRKVRKKYEKVRTNIQKARTSMKRTKKYEKVRDYMKKYG